MARYSVLFSVSGSGQFPMDMLRYDSCYPADTSSAFKILTPEDFGACCAPREVFLRKQIVASTHTGAERAVTIERWASFGWIAKIESTSRLD